MSTAQLTTLSTYAAPDIADALLKLDVPGAGFLADISPISPTTSKIIAPASTVLFVSHSTTSFPAPSEGALGGALGLISTTLAQPLPNVPAGVPYADLAREGKIMVISQPRGQKVAVVGGIMAERMVRLGARGVVVDGRVRDLEVMRGLSVPVWSKGTSIVGSGGEAKAWATDVPIQIDNTEVCPGDIVMIDPVERGAVCIPLKLLDKVLELLPKLVGADEKVIKDVEGGMTVQEAFKLHRGK
ncbi:RraA-like protein [Microthyrium microscopicum]|uniref:RraA-like protein n=1 Tax=Microthyrium microscopicum TaxID=703497 RepID=A0A6A6UQP5_9PEZI|nr:RraA-like protein [Microthyrium microscopicum]